MFREHKLTWIIYSCFTDWIWGFGLGQFSVGVFLWVLGLVLVFFWTYLIQQNMLIELWKAHKIHKIHQEILKVWF